MLLENKYGQVFLTDTNEDRIVQVLTEIETEFSIFTVESGTIS